MEFVVLFPLLPVFVKQALKLLEVLSSLLVFIILC